MGRNIFTMWLETSDPATGKTYFYNEVTRETRWDRPVDMNGTSAPPPPAPASIGEWMEAPDPSTGRLFYFNSVTKETRWERPAEMSMGQQVQQAQQVQMQAAQAAQIAAMSQFTQQQQAMAAYNMQAAQAQAHHQQSFSPSGAAMSGAPLSGAHPNFKSRLCTHFAERGVCGSGERCGFAHGEHDLRQGGSYGQTFINPGMAAPAMDPMAAMMPQAAAYGMAGYGVAMPMQAMGGAAGGQNGNAHPNSKTRLCTHFAESGSCGSGDRCGFAHGDGDLRQPGTYGRMYANPALQPQAQSSPMMGQTQAPRVQNDALLKTKLCSTFMQTGTCNYQHKCRFAHGEADLHRPGEAALTLQEPTQQQPVGAELAGQVSADPLVGPAMPPSTAPPEQPFSAAPEQETQPAMTPIVPPVGGVDDTPLDFGAASNGVKRTAQDLEEEEDSKRAKMEDGAAAVPAAE